MSGNSGISRRRLAARSLLAAIGAGTVSSGLGEANARLQRDAGASLSSRNSGEFSVLDFGADPTASNDSTAAFRAAIGEAEGGTILVPPGTYLVGQIDGLAAAGMKIVGASRWATTLRTEAGGGPLFANERSAVGTSAFHLIADLAIDLNGVPTTAIDLASVNATVVERVHFRGGSGTIAPGTIGVLFDAPLRRGAYDNALHDCSFEYLDRAVVWGSGANTNSAFNCRITNCGTGYDAAPAGGVDTPRIFGGRLEACEVGVRDGASQGAYFGLRFEASRIADIEFTRGSLNAAFFGGHTASSARVLRNLGLASSPTIDGSDIGMLAIEESASRPKISTGRHIFGKPGKVPSIPRGAEYAAYFADHILIDGGIVPIRDGKIKLGGEDRQFLAAYLKEGVFVEGRRTLGAQQPAIADDVSDSANSDTINAILKVLRAHGIIDR